MKTRTRVIATSPPGAAFFAAFLSAFFAALLLVPVASQAQDTLGRLFTTPAQREALDTLRERGPLPAPIETPVVAPTREAPVAVLPDLTVSGIVVRSDGRASAWINGRMVDSGQQSFDGVAVTTARSGRSVQLVLPDSGEALLVRPGQRIQVTSGRVLESYEYEADSDSPSAFGQEEAPSSRAAPGNGQDSLADTTERTLEAIQTLRDLFSGITGDGR